MSKLDKIKLGKIKFINYLGANNINKLYNLHNDTKEISFKDNNKLFDISNFNEHSNLRIPNNIEFSKILSKDEQIKIFKNCNINNTVYKLDKIGETYKKLGYTIEYYINYLNESKNLINKINKEFQININHSVKNLFNLIILEFNNNEYLVNDILKHISIENINLYFIPKIEFNINNNKININIRENDNLYNYIVNNTYDEINKETIIDNIINEAKEVYLYFNTRYNLISSIINQLKINQK
jgi:hypothetical protein